MVDVVRLEDTDAVAQPESAEEDAPRPEQHDPGLCAALGEPVCVDIDLLRRGYMLLDRRRLEVALFGIHAVDGFRLGWPASPI